MQNSLLNRIKIPPWLQSAVGSLGGLGLFAVAFLDSSVLTFPIINDLLVIELSLRHPSRMPYYALMATLGSVAGCTLLYFIARKGGEVMFRRHARHRAEQIRTWMERNGFLTVAAGAMMPPPVPLKPFILAAGVFQVPLQRFTLALFLVRSVRYLGIGYLALRYGTSAVDYVLEHKLRTSLLVLVFVIAGYVLSGLFFRRKTRA